MEQIVREIQDGRDDLLPVLWDLVEEYVRRKALRIYRLSWSGGSVDRYGCALDDYINSAYPGLVDAVRKYDPKRGMSFLSFFSFYLSRSFAEASGRVSKRRTEDPLNTARRLEEEIDDDLFLYDVVPDPDVSEDQVDEQIYLEGLRKHLDRLIDTLSPEDADEIRSAFFDGDSPAQRSEKIGIPVEQVRSRRSRAIENLRSKYWMTKAGKKVQEYIDATTPWTTHVGIRTYQSTFTSSTEILAIQREKRRDKYR